MTPPPAEHLAARIFMGPALRGQPDRRLVDLVRDGYDAAFEEIVRRYRRPLDRFAAGFVGGRSEDVTQDAFSKALPALRKPGAEIELRPWLYRIVRNTALNDLRDRDPAAAELSEALPGARSAAAEVETREELRDLMERLRALPETQRAALVMRELEGLSHEEIAAALGVSGGAARQAIFRARAALREGFGLLVPLPVLRALAEHGGEAGAAGGAVALGGGALKAGMATMLIAGAVGAGVAVEHHHGRAAGPAAAEAAPLAGDKHSSPSGGTQASAGQSSLPGADSHVRSERSREDRGGDRREAGDGGAALSDGDRSGSGGPGPSPSADSHSDGSSHSGGGSSGPSSNSGSSDGSGSGDRHGGRSGSDDGGSHSGSGSDDGGSGGSSDGGGTSSGSGSDDGLVSSDGGGSSGPGGGEIESEPTAADETTLSGDSSGSGDSGSSGGGSDDGGETSGSTSGSGDLSGSGSTSGSDGTR